MRRINTCLATLVVWVSSVAGASSPAAWKELEDTVRKECAMRYAREAGKNAVAPSTLVDVTGGQNIVSAFMRTSSPRGPKPPLFLCLYGKEEKKVLEFYEIASFRDDKSWR